MLNIELIIEFNISIYNLIVRHQHEALRYNFLEVRLDVDEREEDCFWKYSREVLRLSSSRSGLVKIGKGRKHLSQGQTQS